MKIRYAKSTGNFYPYTQHYATLPADIIDVDYADFERAMARQPGQTFSFKRGKLVITDAPSIPFTSLAAHYMDKVRLARDAVLNRLAGIGFAALASGDAATVQAISTARADLLDITTCQLVSAAEDMPALQAAVEHEYSRIASTLPDEARRAFADAGAALPTAPFATPKQ